MNIEKKKHDVYMYITYPKILVSLICIIVLYIIVYISCYM